MSRYVYTGSGPNASDTQYELLGIAKGAGTSKLEQPLHVYRDPATGQLYYRTADDFAEKMELVHETVGKTS